MPTSSEWDAMLGAVNDEFGRAVTLRRVTPGALNVATGERAAVTVDVTVTAHRQVVEEESTSGASGVGPNAVKVVRYSVRKADLGAHVPVKGDFIIDAGAVRTVAQVGESVDGRAFEILTKGEA